MNNQDILRFSGSKLDVKLDSSEYYDYELSKVEGDYNVGVLDLNSPITYESLKINDTLRNCFQECAATIQQFITNVWAQPM